MKTTIRSIVKVEVTKLFGSYNYSLAASSESATLDKVMILYGDNGSGKTTILKLLFHLLAPEDSQGHKSSIAPVPFQKVGIEFSTGERVSAERKEPSTVGSFSMTLQLKGQKAHKVDFTADPNFSVRAASESHNKEIKEFLMQLRTLDLSLFLLSDDRTVRFAGGGQVAEQTEITMVDDDVLLLAEQSELHARRGRRRQMDSESLAQSLLIESLQRAHYWIQTQALHGSSKGESSVNSLYNVILNRLSTLKHGESLQPEASKRSIEDRVRHLEQRSRDYAKYGLMPEFDGKTIVSALSDSLDTQMSVVSNVLTPYFDSIEKKLEALERVYKEVNTFVNVINSFFNHKSIRYEMHRGFEVVSDAGRPLPPQALSSGERHLLLLFLNTITAFERPSLFMIDEPEISLNIKWQRKLLSSLLECIGDNPVQYIFATHSVELLAQHKDNVVKLG